MIRPLALASLIACAVLPSLAATSRADGIARGEGPPAYRARPVRHAASAWHPPRPYAPRAGRFAPSAPDAMLGPDLAYGWLPRNLNLPIYNAPSEGPAPTL